MNYFKQIAFGMLLLTLVMACGKAPSVQSGFDAELTGKWQLESVVQESKTIHKPRIKEGAYDVSLTFKENGELEATSANNYLTGFYETSQQNSIQMGGDGTDRKETAWGEMFINALPNVNQYELSADRLVLYFDHNNKLIFSRFDSKVTASR
jgi:heat shock protein HslJ